jgi:hypothetical protein
MMFAAALLMLSLNCLAQQAEFVGEFQKGLREGSETKYEAMQGMAVRGDYVFSLQHSGILTIYKYKGKSLKTINQFRIGSANPVNHCNVLCFGTERFKPCDRYPVMYTSQCHRKPFNGMKDVCFVERLLPGFKGSELVQTINFEDTDKLFGYALQWVVDCRNKLLIGYGNTIDNNNPANKHRIIAFRLPKLSEGSMVTLKNEDILYTYLLEDTYTEPFMPIGQGLCIRGDLLYMPTGFGTPEKPSILYIWNLAERKMEQVVDLSLCTESEFEDCDFWRGQMLIQSQKGLWKLLSF